jgi:hypothetical protein
MSERDKRPLQAIRMTDADKVRKLLAMIGCSQRAAAKELDINERTMRRYCAGDPVPKYVLMALAYLAFQEAKSTAA